LRAPEQGADLIDATFAEVHRRLLDRSDCPPPRDEPRARPGPAAGRDQPHRALLWIARGHLCGYITVTTSPTPSLRKCYDKDARNYRAGMIVASVVLFWLD
jgi:hypothetical protein